jgi:adenylylsulfate reductase subunit A
VVEEDLDILIIGGGTAACGAAFELAPWLTQARAQGVDIKVKLVDKAALERSGAAAQGLSAINTYLGDNDPADYARMVASDLMGITRDDLTYDLGRHVDDSVRLFEAWGLPVWKQPGDEGRPLAAGGKPVRSGKWQIMISGESFKPIVAEAARKALGRERIQEHVFIVRLVNDANDRHRIAGAVGFSLREHKVYVYRFKACLLVTGGCAAIFRPRSVGEGLGRTWYPAWNAGSTYAMAAEAGAELTMMENRFVPTRFKDGYGPVGAWFLLFKSRVINAYGEEYAKRPEAQALLEPYAPYDRAYVTPSCLRNHLLLNELLEGRGPVFMDTVSALGRLAETMTPREIKRLESEAWEDCLDMSIAQAGVWAGENIEPEKKGSELMPTEPYLLGSHAGCCGLWVSGPGDLGAPTDEDHPERDRIPRHLPEGWNWGYRSMTTVAGLFTAADGVGASGHKSSSGAHAEGRIAAKAMVKFVLDHPDHSPELDTPVAELVAAIYRPLHNFLAHRDDTTAIDVNPAYITPRMLQMRLQKLMDEYVAGVGANYRTNAKLLEVAEAKLEVLKDDALQMRAKDLHELLRAWENSHRLLAAEAHLKHIQFREETRYPGFYYRMDFNHIDDTHWKCFVNSVYDRETRTWTLFKRQHVDLVDKAASYKANRGA